MGQTNRAAMPENLSLLRLHLQSANQLPRICSLPKSIGWCSSSVRRFYYDTEIRIKRCEIFYYGGCGGNANNFLTKNECISKCRGKVKINHPQVCKLRRKVGRCKGKLERYYFDMGRKRCQPFTYSGCGGNENRFVTRVDCLLSCENMGKKNNYDFSAIWVTNFVLICVLLPKDTGPCKASIPLFYFDIRSGQCEDFVYGGCGGNANIFLTWDECFSKCGGNVKINHPQVVLLIAKGLHYGLHCIILRILTNSSDGVKSVS
uniref:BPTI/Kunitz inhibitor domain-containing protein n=1 Tax=Anolis carolinensis TaxID=28377 RepID=H9GUT9_ANOCA